MTDDMTEDETELPSSGWSMTVGELRAALEGVPDDYEVMLDQGDCEISEVHISHAGLFEPLLGSVGLLVLDTGQVVSSEYAYGLRMDLDHDTNCNPSWSPSERKWDR